MDFKKSIKTLFNCEAFSNPRFVYLKTLPQSILKTNFTPSKNQGSLLTRYTKSGNHSFHTTFSIPLDSPSTHTVYWHELNYNDPTTIVNSVYTPSTYLPVHLLLHTVFRWCILKCVLTHGSCHNCKIPYTHLPRTSQYTWCILKCALAYIKESCHNCKIPYTHLPHTTQYTSCFTQYTLCILTCVLA